MPRFSKDNQPGRPSQGEDALVTLPPEDGGDMPPPPAVAEEATMPPKSTAESPLYYARFVIPGTGHLTLYQVDYDQGEILTLMAGPKNAKLIDQGHIEILNPGSERHFAQCGVCGKWFISEYRRDEHGIRRHRDRFGGDDLEVAEGMLAHVGSAAVRDTTGDAEERRLMQEAPLKFGQAD